MVSKKEEKQQNKVHPDKNSILIKIRMEEIKYPTNEVIQPCSLKNLTEKTKQ